MKYLGSVNVWLLAGDPLTLVDTGPSTAEALAALEQQLSLHDVALEDLEQILLTHHHLDHSGLASAIKRRSGARLAAHGATAQWGRRWREQLEAERRFTRTLISEHGVPASLSGDVDRFLAEIEADSSAYDTDLELADGDLLRAGDRVWRTVFRPGHSATDTLYVDDAAEVAFVGDHLLAEITSGVELMPAELPGGERRRALVDYLGNLRRTQVMPLRRAHTGHGPDIDDHVGLIDDRLAFHAERLERIQRLVGEGCASAFEIAGRLWSEETAAASPVLVVWEVLGHLDLLVNRGVVREEREPNGRRRFLPRAQREVKPASTGSAMPVT